MIDPHSAHNALPISEMRQREDEYRNLDLGHPARQGLMMSGNLKTTSAMGRTTLTGW
jgi:hypothetical protein